MAPPRTKKASGTIDSTRTAATGPGLDDAQGRVGRIVVDPHLHPRPVLSVKRIDVRHAHKGRAVADACGAIEGVAVLAAFICLAGTQVLSWTFAFPVNQETANWTVRPEG